MVIGYDEKNLPKTKNVLAKTKSECVEKLKQLQEQYAPPKSDKIKLEMPFGEWMDFWYQNYSKPKLRPTTRSGYEGRIYRHIISDLGNIPLDQLTQNDLQQFYARLKKSGRLLHAEHYGKGLSDRMVRACHMNCRSALEKAVQEGLIRMNPAVGCKLPPKKAREMQVLTREEIQRFLIHAKAEGYFELFLLELTTGLRRGELLALQWDFQAQNEILHPHGQPASDASEHSERVQGERKLPVDVPRAGEGGLASGPGLHQNAATPHPGTRPV